MVGSLLGVVIVYYSYHSLDMSSTPPPNVNGFIIAFIEYLVFGIYTIPMNGK